MGQCSRTKRVSLADGLVPVHLTRLPRRWEHVRAPPPNCPCVCRSSIAGLTQRLRQPLIAARFANRITKDAPLPDRCRRRYQKKNSHVSRSRTVDTTSGGPGGIFLSVTRRLTFQPPTIGAWFICTFPVVAQTGVIFPAQMGAKTTDPLSGDGPSGGRFPCPNGG